MYSRLGAVDSIESLVEEEADGPAVVDPRRAVLIESRVVPQERQDIENDEQEACQCNQIGCHAHWKQLDNEIVVKRLKDVFGCQRPVNGGVLVLLQRRKLTLSEINHAGPGEAMCVAIAKDCFW